MSLEELMKMRRTEAKATAKAAKPKAAAKPKPPPAEKKKPAAAGGAGGKKKGKGVAAAPRDAPKAKAGGSARGNKVSKNARPIIARLSLLPRTLAHTARARAPLPSRRRCAVSSSQCSSSAAVSHGSSPKSSWSCVSSG